MLCIGDEQNLNVFLQKFNYSFFTQSAVEMKHSVFNKPYSCNFQHGKKRENSSTGNENDKLIEPYIAQPPVK